MSNSDRFWKPAFFRVYSNALCEARGSDGAPVYSEDQATELAALAIAQVEDANATIIEPQVFRGHYQSRVASTRHDEGTPAIATPRAVDVSVPDPEDEEATTLLALTGAIRPDWSFRSFSVDSFQPQEGERRVYVRFFRRLGRWECDGHVQPSWHTADRGFNV
jgi:hypothetical protein